MTQQNRPTHAAPMSKALFLEQLRNGISSLPGRRIQEIEEDIGQHFDEGALSGADEAELCAMLGDPSALAAEYVTLYEQEQSGLMEMDPPKAPPPPEPPPVADWQPSAKKRRNPFLTCFLGFWMFIFALCLPFPIWCALGSVWIVLACGFILLPAGILGLLVAPLSLIFPLHWISGGNFVVSFFGSISCIALGGLMMMATVIYGRWLLGITRRYLRFHWRVVTGNGGEDA